MLSKRLTALTRATAVLRPVWRSSSDGGAGEESCWLRIVVTQAFSVVSYWLSVSIAFVFVRRVLGLVASAFCHPYSRVAFGGLDLPSRSLGYI